MWQMFTNILFETSFCRWSSMSRISKYWSNNQSSGVSSFVVLFKRRFSIRWWIFSAAALERLNKNKSSTENQTKATATAAPIVLVRDDFCTTSMTSSFYSLGWRRWSRISDQIIFESSVSPTTTSSFEWEWSIDISSRTQEDQDYLLAKALQESEREEEARRRQANVNIKN